MSGSLLLTLNMFNTFSSVSAVDFEQFDMTCLTLWEHTYLSNLPEITRKIPKYIYFRKDYSSENYRNLVKFLL